MNSQQIRQQFLDFFAAKAHTVVDSSPVVPHDDPTLMFTNAGMNQFKDVFLGTGSRSYKRAVDTQKCIRAGGKHNDLDDVGQDTYHHTFFEMLGNWSFGDYFKKEAIQWAWELFTEVWGIDKDRLHATYFEGDEAEGLEPDHEARKLWKSETTIDPTHVHPGNKKDNFWEMGDTGPCGPCSELHIDLTPDKSGASLVNAGDPRVIELWNLVFIQYNRDSAGKLTPLPAQHVDTGLGFERLAAVILGMETDRLGQVSNYDTDVFTPIFDAIRKRTGAPAYCGTLPSEEGSRDQGNEGSRKEETTDQYRDRKGAASGETRADATNDPSPERKRRVTQPTDTPTPPDHEQRINHDQIMTDVSYRVIADHVRCLTFALTDGSIPSNEGRGYVLRRILRRAVRYGRQYMNMHEPFLCDLIAPVVDHMANVFPELRKAHGGKNVERVIELIRDEEASFVKTLDRGIDLFDAAARNSIMTTILDPDLPLGPSAIVGSLSQSTGELIVYGDADCVLPASPDQGRPEDTVIPRDAEGQREVIAKYCKRQPIISGKDAFRLHDTYGFPVDLTQLMAEELGMAVDIDEYERLMEEARERARGTVKWREDGAIFSDPDMRARFLTSASHKTRFTGHETATHDPSVSIVYISIGDRFSSEALSITKGQRGIIVLDESPFYAEKGGQVSDNGDIVSPAGKFRVTDVHELEGRILHVGECVEGEFRVWLRSGPGAVRSPESRRQDAFRSQDVRAIVNYGHRRPVMQNHTATHMLNWALRKVLGDHIQQKGSLVDPEKTRFDLSHNKPLTGDELARIEELVNEKIEQDLPVYTKEVEQKKALEIKTLRAVFGEKYPDVVRVVSVGAPIDEEQATEAGRSDFLLGSPDDPKWMEHAVEFCGGTHVAHTGEAGRFVLISEEAVAKGVRRVVGISGDAAKQAVDLGQQLLAEVNALAGKPPVAPSTETTDQYRDRKGAASDEPHADATDQHRDREGAALGVALSAFQQKFAEAVIPIRVRHDVQQVIAELQKKVKEHAKKAAGASGDAAMDVVAGLLGSAETVGGVTVVVGEVPQAPTDALRGAIDWVRNKTESSAVLLATASDDKVTLIAGMSKSVVKKGVKAGDLIKEVAPLVGGRGGGRPDMAQGGGSDPSGIPGVLERAKSWIGGKLTQ